MVNLQKSGDSAVQFVFTDSDHYLYGNGEIEVPVNSLLLVIDESDMVTFKKLSGDPFLSFRADNSNLGTKAAIEQFYKDNMVGSTGGGSESGITSGEVQTMIDNSLEDYYTDDEVDAALSGKASVSDVTAVANDVQTLSGQVATKVATSDFNAYSATTDARIAEDEEVTAAALNNLDENKQDALEYYSEDTTVNTATIHIENTDDGTVGEVYVDGASVDISALRTEEDEDNGSMVETHSDINGNNAGIAMSYEKLVDDEEAAHSYLNVNEGLISMEVMANEETTNVDVYSTGVTINGDAVATEPYVDAALSGKVDTSAITTAITSGSTDAEIPTAKAVYDAIPTGGGGVTVDSAIDTGSTNPVQNAVIAANTIKSFGVSSTNNYDEVYGNNFRGYQLNDTKFYAAKINGGHILAKYPSVGNFSLVETTAITSAMTSSSTDAQVPSAKAVYDTLGGLKFVQCSQSEYDALVSGGTVDSSTIYFISNVVS